MVKRQDRITSTRPVASRTTITLQHHPSIPCSLPTNKRDRQTYENPTPIPETSRILAAYNDIPTTVLLDITRGILTRHPIAAAELLSFYDNYLAELKITKAKAAKRREQSAKQSVKRKEAALHAQAHSPLHFDKQIDRCAIKFRSDSKSFGIGAAYDTDQMISKMIREIQDQCAGNSHWETQKLGTWALIKIVQEMVSGNPQIFRGVRLGGQSTIPTLCGAMACIGEDLGKLNEAGRKSILEDQDLMNGIKWTVRQLDS